MNTIDPITKFDGRHAFLSNFFPCRVEFEEMVFPSSEHAFQAAKTLDHSIRLQMLSQPTPGKAKRLGRTIELRDDWEWVKIPTMRTILLFKFSHPNLRRLLIATAPAELIEGNNWNDTFWGFCNGVGRNELGKLLMEIRG
jgi:ribA/ribD-fused uncharacterized protein